MYRPSTTKEWALCGMLLVQAIVTIALEIYLLAEWQLWVTPTIVQVPVSYVVPINIAILVFACVYEVVLALDAIHQKNNILLFAICVCNTCVFTYSIMQYRLMEQTTARLYRDRSLYPTLIDTTRNLWHRIQPTEIVLSIAMGLTTLLVWPCAFFLHKEYSWAIYKCVHGSVEIRRRYLFYEVFLVLIKLNFFFLIGFIVQYNLIWVHSLGLEYTLTMCLIPGAFFCMLLGIYFVRNEKLFGAVTVIVCYLGLLAWLISRTIVLCNGDTLGKGMIMLFAILSLLLTVATVVCAIICITNFDRGFKMVNRSKHDAATRFIPLV